MNMKDTQNCPICNNYLKNIKKDNHYLYNINHTDNYISHTCSLGMNHFLQFFTQKESKNVHFLKVSLTPNYSRFVEIDFFNNKSKISYFKPDKGTEYIELKKAIEPDFPKLILLKEKVDTLVNFL